MPLRVDYDLSLVQLKLPDLRGRPPTLWRYHEVLPLDQAAAVSLGEGFTPLLEVERNVWVKDESRNPTGSFKARGMAVAVSMAKQLGARALAAPSAGNAAGALAAYGARGGLPVTVAMPEDTPAPFFDECELYGAQIHRVRGHHRRRGKISARARRSLAPSTSPRSSEPYRIEGKKTMAYELVEQMEGDLPDVILYPTGGGTGLVGMWKAFDEMERLGWIGPRRPRFVSVQVTGCAPVVKAFLEGAERTEPWADAQTHAYGLRVPSPIGGFICLRVLRATCGTAIAVTDDEADAATRALAAKSGIDVCPEGGAAWAALARLRAQGWVKPHEKVVVFNTGTGLKYR